MTESVNNIDQIWSRAGEEISAHWASCEASGLDHTQSNRDEVLASFEKFITFLKSKTTSDPTTVIGSIRTLYSELNQTNDKYEGGLLETEERELLVPIIIELAAAAGVDPEEYDGEPGSEYRDF